ncbi:hypothetical protein KP22_03420 [Pectobacterium betavasculorum]|uniref:Uncharacterized protein n=1 Tax=Pectobacterium betavasculorum TaxID=55207 RepID=A0A093TJ90_9GAMM|nr:hypothetical protein [Pectobacterium betavasculorum]KFX07153.1 hypothetical protein KP22_03420 [Pectobacterium betavasculorum]KFX22481.1 hypothetical protein JV35_04745 [Pectobacterium betavasculorum]
MNLIAEIHPAGPSQATFKSVPDAFVHGANALLFYSVTLVFHSVNRFVNGLKPLFKRLYFFRKALCKGNVGGE